MSDELSFEWKKSMKGEENQAIWMKQPLPRIFAVEVATQQPSGKVIKTLVFFLAQIQLPRERVMSGAARVR